MGIPPPASALWPCQWLASSQAVMCPFESGLVSGRAASVWRLAGGLPRLGPSALCWPWLVRAYSPPAPPPLPLSAPGARSPPGPLTQGRRVAQASPRSGHRRGRAALPVREEEGLRASAHQPGRPQPGAALRPGVWVPPRSSAQPRVLRLAAPTSPGPGCGPWEPFPPSRPPCASPEPLVYFRPPKPAKTSSSSARSSITTAPFSTGPSATLW